MYSSLLILKKKYTAANTAKRNTEENVINKLHKKETSAKTFLFLCKQTDKPGYVVE